MISIINFFKDNYLIILILVTGSLFKIPVIWESYPIINNLDEPYLINSGLRVLNNIYLHKSPDPEFYTWGSFPISEKQSQDPRSIHCMLYITFIIYTMYSL